MPRTIFSALLGYNNGNQMGSKFQCKLLGNVVVTNEKLFMLKVTALFILKHYVESLKHLIFFYRDVMASFRHSLCSWLSGCKL